MKGREDEEADRIIRDIRAKCANRSSSSEYSPPRTSDYRQSSIQESYPLFANDRSFGVFLCVCSLIFYFVFEFFHFLPQQINAWIAIIPFIAGIYFWVEGVA
jgi:hypothetical protein